MSLSKCAVQGVIVKNQNLLKNKKPKDYAIVLSIRRIFLLDGSNLARAKVPILNGYRSKQESKNPKVVRTKNGRLILLSKCAVRNSKKWKCIKEQEAK